VLWGIQYIVCMCIIIDISDIRNDCMGTSRGFGGGGGVSLLLTIGYWGVMVIGYDQF
jgi:hypothetical protein